MKKKNLHPSRFSSEGEAGGRVGNGSAWKWWWLLVEPKYSENLIYKNMKEKKKLTLGTKVARRDFCACFGHRLPGLP